MVLVEPREGVRLYTRHSTAAIRLPGYVGGMGSAPNAWS